MFDSAQRRVQYIMEQDSYVRFRDSDLFIRALDLLKIKNSKWSIYFLHHKICLASKVWHADLILKFEKVLSFIVSVSIIQDSHNT